MKYLSIILVFVLGLGFSAWAELTAVVAPGYTFASGERPDTAKLNRLGNPTITITGTLSGTNAGISAGSINANMFSASVVDDATLDFTNSSPQALRIKAAGVGAREISSAIAGPGLTGGSGAILTNNVDGVTLIITNDVVTLATNPPAFIAWTTNTLLGASTFGTNAQLSVSPAFAINTNSLNLRQFTTAALGLTNAGLVISTNHALGAVPTQVRAVLVCLGADGLFDAGDEIDLATVANTQTSVPAIIVANSTSIKVWCSAFYDSNVYLSNLGSPSGTVYLTGSKWAVKVYARP